MFAFAIDAHQRDMCESEWKLDELEREGKLLAATESYGIGLRTTAVLMPLAYARVWSLNVGSVLAPPNGWSQTAWNAELDRLVKNRLGTFRCLDCGNFHNDGPQCPSCRPAHEWQSGRGVSERIGA